MTRTALVTGGGRGIGAAIAVALAMAGFDIAIASREREAEAAGTVDRVRTAGVNVLYVEHDISRIEQHRGVLERVHRELGGVHCLVNNAGVTSLRRGDMLDDARELRPHAGQQPARHVLPDADGREGHAGTDVGAAVATLAEGRLPFATGDIVNIGGGLHLHRV